MNRQDDHERFPTGGKKRDSDKKQTEHARFGNQNAQFEVASSGLENASTLTETSTPWQSTDQSLSNAWQDAPSSVMATQAGLEKSRGFRKDPPSHETELAFGNQNDDFEIADLGTDEPASRAVRPQGGFSNIVWPERDKNRRRR